jgi:hypothetical protein
VIHLVGWRSDYGNTKSNALSKCSNLLVVVMVVAGKSGQCCGGVGGVAQIVDARKQHWKAV